MEVRLRKQIVSELCGSLGKRRAHSLTQDLNGAIVYLNGNSQRGERSYGIECKVWLGPATTVV